MAGLYQQFKTDKDVERNGVWLDYGNNSNGQPIRILVARAGGGNVEFSKAMERAGKPYRRQIQTGTMDENTSKRMTMQVYVESIIKGWEGVEDEDGNPLAFNAVNVEKVMTDLPDLFLDIIQQSQSSALYRETIREQDLGN